MFKGDPLPPVKPKHLALRTESDGKYPFVLCLNPEKDGRREKQEENRPVGRAGFRFLKNRKAIY